MERKNLNYQNSNRSTDGFDLNSSEQKLLMKYHDNECGRVQKWLIERKLSANNDWSISAENFLESLRQLSNQAKLDFDGLDFDGLKLNQKENNLIEDSLKLDWSTIEAKIAREESLNKVTHDILSKDSIYQEKPDKSALALNFSDLFDKFIVNPLIKLFSTDSVLNNYNFFNSTGSARRWLEKLNWAATGSFATACLGLIFININAKSSNTINNSNKQLSNSSYYSSQNTVQDGVSSVSYNNEQRYNGMNSNRQRNALQRNILSGGYRLGSIRPSVDIDWIKTDKSVHLINSPRQKSPIIWVRRDSNSSNAPQRAVIQEAVTNPEDSSDNQFFTVERIYDSEDNKSEYANTGYEMFDGSQNNQNNANFKGANFKRELSFEGYK